MLDLQDLARQGYTFASELLNGLGGDQEREEFLQRLKDRAYRPGDQVRLRQDLIARWIVQFTPKPAMTEYVSVLHALKNVGDNRLDVEGVHVDAVGDVLYTFVGSDLKVEASFCTNPRPYIHQYGVLTLQEDRVWFVHIDDESCEAKQVFEITQEPGRAAQQQLGTDSLTALVDLLGTEPDQAMAGEFAVEDHGAETWGLLYTPWSSSASEQVLKTAVQAIKQTMSASPVFN